MPLNITTIDNPCGLLFGMLEMYLVSDIADAARCAAGRRAYLYQSKINGGLYLFVEQS